ncbi:MAG: alpha/beta hydrolase [Flavobacteriaceae bacterium]|nr:alpha/beta hydrolase [Flavobacteriaceae bacterium]
MKVNILILLMLVVGLKSEAQKVIQLYEGKPKGSENWNWNEALSDRAKVIYNVSQPTLTAYLPDPAIATGTAVIVAPGGAFHVLVIDNEGVDVANYLNSKGIAAFVLKYRLVHILNDPADAVMGEIDSKKLDEENAPVVPLAMADGLAAVQYVRDHAKEMNISPGKIGFMGFSAGGTVAMSVVYNAVDANRPNFVAPIYPYTKAIIGTEIPKAKTPIFWQ